MKFNPMSSFKFQPLLVALLVMLGGVFEGTAETPRITFRAIAFETVPGFENVVFDAADGKRTVLALSELSFSKEYTASATQGIGFYSESIQQLPESRETTDLMPAAFAPPVDNSGEVLLIFVPAENNDGAAYKVWQVPSDNRRFSAGATMFLNFSENTMVAKIDDAQIDLPPGTPSMVPFVGNGDRFNGPVQIAVYMEKTWRKFYSSHWTIPKQSKTLVMIYSNVETGLPLLKAVSYQM